MNYRLLNEVLIEWNESSKDDSDNVFLKSEDIKESLDQYFIYRLDKKRKTKIFNNEVSLQYPWLEFEKYRDKVWINGKHIKLDNQGFTVDEFEPREYKVYIEDIDKITNTDSMFWNCPDLVSAFIPRGTNQINSGHFIFGNCGNLKDISIPSFIIYIDMGAFINCEKLASVTIPNSVTEIGNSAFRGCSGLTSVTIPNSVTSIGDNAFYDCKNLKTVYVEDINKFNQIEFKGKTADPRCYGAKVIELKK